jgi:hypothetical protein
MKQNRITQKAALRAIVDFPPVQNFEGGFVARSDRPPEMVVKVMTVLASAEG